jgi:hypothetical protein
VVARRVVLGSRAVKKHLDSRAIVLKAAAMTVPATKDAAPHALKVVSMRVETTALRVVVVPKGARPRAVVLATGVRLARRQAGLPALVALAAMTMRQRRVPRVTVSATGAMPSEPHSVEASLRRAVRKVDLVAQWLVANLAEPRIGSEARSRAVARLFCFEAWLRAS